ncbi:hypothetical protein CRG98_033493 [Punica granatum]|uniref:Uncharacterized protein n=1 Tax=Punica granatum TaxID=22663 RepID=A0A2I0IQ12_PUNGR|nr:hypothetical protein CRG98_033493 [Punica granatum]
MDDQLRLAESVDSLLKSEHGKRGKMKKKKCTCDATLRYVEQRERENAHQFPLGLNMEDSTVRSNILSTEPPHSLNKIFHMILHEESQSQVVRNHESGPKVVFLGKMGNG